jgi:hypothetical protein
MEETRASIGHTVEELRGKVNDALDWRQYVNRYPGASLTVAVAAGMLLGRGLGGLVRRNGRGEDAEPYGYQYRTAETYGEGGFTAAASRAAHSAYEAAEPAVSGARRAMGQSVSRLGSRAEGILNRVIDELTDAVETTLVPALTSRFRSFIDLNQLGNRRRAGGSGGDAAGRARWEEPGTGREERGGVYPGGPAGPQHYPTQGRSAEHV